MRGLILTGILGMALPAFGAGDPAPVMGATAPEEVMPTPEPIRGEAVPAVSPSAVARATFATAIDQREPVDSISSLGSDRDRVYYFTEFVGLSGRRLTHRWEYEDELVAEVPIAIDGPRWRAYSTKNLEAGRLGEWTVSVLDESGNVVRTDSFVYEAAAPAPEVVAPATPAALTTPATPADGEAPSETPASPAPTQP
jgi:hypothetical protein